MWTPEDATALHDGSLVTMHLLAAKVMTALGRMFHANPSNAKEVGSGVSIYHTDVRLGYCVTGC